MTPTRKRLLAVGAVFAFILASCGGSDANSDTASTDGDQATTTESGDATTTTGADDTGDSGDTGDSTAAPEGDPLTIAALTSLTGNFTPWGVQVRDGMTLAVADINEAGGINGRPLELEVVDDQSNAEEGIAQFQRLSEEGVIGVVGGISSDVAVATSVVAEQNEVPYVVVKAGSDQVLTRDSRYTFRSCLPAAPMLGDILFQGTSSEGFTKSGAIIADYGWGRALEATLKDFFDGSDIELQVEVAPVGEQDFTTYLRNLQDFGAQNLITTGHPPGGGAISVQSNDLGFSVPQIGSATPMDLIADSAPDAAIGRYTDIKCIDFNSPGYQDLAKRYMEISDNKIMSDDAVAAYAITMAMAKAAAESPEPADVAAYLHANTFESPGMAFPHKWTEWGELAEATPTLSRITGDEPPEGVSKTSGWWIETVVTVDPLTPYEP